MSYGWSNILKIVRQNVTKSDGKLNKFAFLKPFITHPIGSALSFLSDVTQKYILGMTKHFLENIVYALPYFQVNSVLLICKIK